MPIVYIVGGAIVFVGFVLLLLRLRRKPSEKKTFTIDELSLSQKNKKRKHFGFSKGKTKKNNADTEEVINLELLEKKGKKKAKNKAKASGKKKIVQKPAESHHEADSEKESTDAEEDKEHDTEDSEVEEQMDNFTKESAEKPVLATKAQTTAAVKTQQRLEVSLPEKTSNEDSEKSDVRKKTKKNKPRKEDEDEARKETPADSKEIKEKLVLVVDEKKKNTDENWQLSDANSDSSPIILENGKPDSVAAANSKNAKKKKKKNKPNANADILPATESVNQVVEVLQNVPVVSAELDVEKLGLLEEEDIEDGFVQVTQELPISKASDTNKPVKDVDKKPTESELEKSLKTALNAELAKVQTLQEQFNKEQHQNEFLKQALEQIGLQIQEKETNRVKLERSLEQQSHELKSLNARLKDSLTLAQKLRDENQALKEALTKAQQHAVDEAQKAELQQRVRVMDDALKQNALQLNSIDNARKDLEIREKRQLERIMLLERELQASKAELSDCRQNAEQRCQALSSEIQRLNHELPQVEQMKTCYMELEKQKADLERQNTELINYGRTKDVEHQRLQSEVMEVSRMNETFQRRSRELETRASDRDALAGQSESLRQQLGQKDAELQILHQKEVELQRKEAEFARLDAELHLLRQKAAESESEIRDLHQKALVFAQKEAEFLQKESQVNLSAAEFQQRETGHNLRIQELESQVAKCAYLEDELSGCRAEIQQLGAKEIVLTKEVDRLTRELSAVENQDELSKELIQLKSDNEFKETKIVQLSAETQELKDKVSELQTSVSERDSNAENFAQVQSDLNLRLEKALLMQQELDKQKRENSVLHDEIEHTKSELLQRLADNDAQLRRELEEKDREIEKLKSHIKSSESILDGQDAKVNEIFHKSDNSVQEEGKQELQSDAQISPEADRQ